MSVFAILFSVIKFKSMKKVLLSVAFILGFGVYGFATNKIQIDQGQKDKTEKTVPGQTQKYNFSLFKFIRTSPTIKKEPTDSIKRKEESKKHHFKDETTENNYEKPFSFFRLS